LDNCKLCTDYSCYSSRQHIKPLSYHLSQTSAKCIYQLHLTELVYLYQQKICFRASWSPSIQVLCNYDTLQKHLCCGQCKQEPYPD